VHIVEIGGTVGDYESLSFIEAIRELGVKVGLENCAYVHVVYLPYLGASNETKTKPAQNSVRELRGLGIAPDILVGRSEKPANDAVKKKLSLFSGCGRGRHRLLPTLPLFTRCTLTLEDTGTADVIVERLGLKAKSQSKGLAGSCGPGNRDHPRTVRIGFVAKYMEHTTPTCRSSKRSKSAAWHNDCALKSAGSMRAEFDAPGADIAAELKDYDGILVPGGFGQRGLEGKIKAAHMP